MTRFNIPAGKKEDSENPIGTISETLKAREYRGKRFFDIILAVVGVLFFLPLALIIAVFLFFEDFGSVFYFQERVGKGGRVFRIWKFRSMKKEAEKGSGAVYSEERDPRVTRVGRILRNTAMDELPQLVNILAGDLSFVGPRPERPELAEKIIEVLPEFGKRSLIRPGLTGIAQVEGRYDSTPAEKLKMDLEYVNKMSFTLDMKLIGKSIIITIKGAWNARDKKKR